MSVRETVVAYVRAPRDAQSLHTKGLSLLHNRGCSMAFDSPRECCDGVQWRAGCTEALRCTAFRSLDVANNARSRAGLSVWGLVLLPWSVSIAMPMPRVTTEIPLCLDVELMYPGLRRLTILFLQVA